MKNGASQTKNLKIRSSDKTVRERLATLVIAFLEEEIGRGDLLSDPGKIDHYRNLLEENLWQERMDLHDPNWNFDSDLSDIVIDNPGLYPADEVTRANLEQGINAILYFHGLLKSFWDEFKKHLEAFQGVLRERESIKTLSDAEKNLKGLDAGGMDLEGLGQPLLDAIHSKREYSQEIQSPITLRINYSFEPGKVHFFYTGIDAVRALMDLLKDMPIAAFKRCKDDKGCGKWFVLTSKRKRDFCSHLCAARYTERMRREKSPEKFLEYHRQYYDKHLKKSNEPILTEVK